jgi:hypothetical protein
MVVNLAECVPDERFFEPIVPLSNGLENLLGHMRHAAVSECRQELIIRSLAVEDEFIPA